MSDIKIDLTLKALSPQEAMVITKYLGGEIATLPEKEDAAPAKAAPKKSKKKAAAKAKAPEPKIEVVDASSDEEEDDWDDDAPAGDNSKYAEIKKWRELATVLVGDGFNTAPTLLAKCQELTDICPALAKIPPDNLVTRCDRAIEVLGA